MNDFSISKVKDYFHLYYSNIEGDNFFKIKELKNREFAFSFFDKVGMTRHTSFADYSEMINFVKNNVPQHFYYSSAYYKNPSADMDQKEWDGADLIFDIDGDHIEGSETMKYSEMLEAVKKEMKKLIVLLRDDFSIGWNNMELVFSGSRGYHLHVYDIFRENESQERREIVDYITGRCTRKEFPLNPKNKWNLRIEENIQMFKNIIENEKKWKDVLSNRFGLDLKDIKSKRDSTLINIIDTKARSKAKEDYAPLIDEPVTTDIHRLIRTPNSLHGKSGLRVIDIEPNKFDNFNPLYDAIPNEFKETKANVRVIKGIISELNGDNLELKEGNYSIPVYDALFAVLKGSAEFLDTGLSGR